MKNDFQSKLFDYIQIWVNDLARVERLDKNVEDLKRSKNKSKMGMLPCFQNRRGIFVVLFTIEML